MNSEKMENLEKLRKEDQNLQNVLEELGKEKVNLCATLPHVL